MSLISRRALLMGGTATAIAVACAPRQTVAAPSTSADSNAFADSDWRALTEADWEARLSPIAFRVMRHEGTERPWTSEFNDEKRDGTYHCAGCDLILFASDKKFDSGTGWPSFFDVIAENIGTSTDYKIGYPRTEYHCARCLGHQGHVFKDGPRPTGLRYCNNGVALTFKPSAEA